MKVEHLGIDCAMMGNKMKKSVVFLLMLLVVCLTTTAQKRERYEFYKNFPVYADSLIAHSDYPLAWGTDKTRHFKKWKKKALRQVFACMGPSLCYEKPRFDSIEFIRLDNDSASYNTFRVLIPASPYYEIPALLLIPKGQGPFPAVNVLHDHGAHLYIGKEKMVRPVGMDAAVLDDADQWVQQLYGGQYLGNYLAENGYVVLTADAPMWGERGREEGADRSQYDIVAGNMMMYGYNLCAQMTYDDLTTTDFLCSLPQVDHERVGCAGFSMGGYRAWMLSALSSKIRAGAAISWMVTTDVQMTWNYGRKENGGFANCIPGLRRYLDYPHIASIACPKPMLFVNGRQDKLFPVIGVEKAFSIMHDVWKSQKADHQLQTELWDIPHECNKEVQERILHFLDEQFKK